MNITKLRETIFGVSMFALCFGSLVACVVSHNTKASYYRQADNGNGLHYETVTERTEKCVYLGNNKFETSDGNVWEFSDGVKREVIKGYKITISDNGTKNVEDDIVTEVK